MTPAMLPAGATSLSVRVGKILAREFLLKAEFEAEAGITILFGQSGSGKSTLLNCIAGLIAPDVGRIALDTTVLFDSERRVNIRARKRSVGYLFQNLALFPHLTVEQNVQYGLAKAPAAVREKKVFTILESFRIAHLLTGKPNELSGGERQRVALARSLVTDPKVLLLDEPLTALDASTKSEIIADLRAWNASHEIPIIYVTHAVREAFALGERVVVLDNGRVVAKGTPQEVLVAPRHEIIANLAGFENVFDATVDSVSESQGTMNCHLIGSEVNLEVPLVTADQDARIRVAIRAGDIMVATGKPVGLSARNTLKGIIVSLRREAVTMIVTVNTGVNFEVHLTPNACRELNLKPRDEAWLVIKTYSCHLVNRDDVSPTN
jgi:molybdate transport system ATP-binding protein